jgi:hypothetical protein
MRKVSYWVHHSLRAKLESLGTLALRLLAIAVTVLVLTGIVLLPALLGGEAEEEIGAVSLKGPSREADGGRPSSRDRGEDRNDRGGSERDERVQSVAETSGQAAEPEAAPPAAVETPALTQTSGGSGATGGSGGSGTQPDQAPASAAQSPPKPVSPTPSPTPAPTADPLVPDDDPDESSSDDAGD